MINLLTPIEEIPKIGPAYQKRLKKLGIKNVRDLLFYFPTRYDDFSNIIPIKKVKLGYTVCLQGEIIEIKNIRTSKKFMNITEITVQDKTGSFKALWFNQPYLAKTFKEDDFVCLQQVWLLDYVSEPKMPPSLDAHVRVRLLFF